MKRPLALPLGNPPSEQVLKQAYVGSVWAQFIPAQRRTFNARRCDHLLENTGKPFERFYSVAAVIFSQFFPGCAQRKSNGPFSLKGITIQFEQTFLVQPDLHVRILPSSAFVLQNSHQWY